MILTNYQAQQATLQKKTETSLINTDHTANAILHITYLAGNLYMYPRPSSLQMTTRSAARKSPPNQRSPRGDITEHNTEKSPAS